MTKSINNAFFVCTHLLTHYLHMYILTIFFCNNNLCLNNQIIILSEMKTTLWGLLQTD